MSPNLFANFTGILADAASQTTSGDGLYLPVQASTYASEIDHAFNFILVVCTFFFALIVGIATYFVIIYRRKPGVAPEPSPSHHTLLEVTWTILPSLILVYMFFIGIEGFTSIYNTNPDGEIDVTVKASKWKWEFKHGDHEEVYDVEGKLHCYVGQKVRLTLQSEDFLHSLYIPAFRLKMDVVPGQYRKTWFQATRAGEYDIYCAEY
ncbi:MAG: cytochrome c oxidase subunit II, partial [Pirellulaceae bacterium]|nr:cytochrome c oxidase subunit II [Pirellulaceae bacterium]